MKNVCGNEKGMSLLGVIISMGIMGILMMTLADLTVLMTKNNITAQANSDILAYTNQVRTSLQSPERATTMLVGNVIDSTQAITIKDPVVSGQVMAQAGTKQSTTDAWQVKRIAFENVAQSPSVGLYKMTLVMVFEKDQNRIIGPSVSRRVIGDVYCFVSGNAITTCTGGSDPIAAAKVQCQALGGAWSDTAAFGTQCQITAGPSPAATSDGKSKGDHNDDGHPDNGKDKSPCDGDKK